MFLLGGETRLGNQFWLSTRKVVVCFKSLLIRPFFFISNVLLEPKTNFSLNGIMGVSCEMGIRSLSAYIII